MKESILCANTVNFSKFECTNNNLSKFFFAMDILIKNGLRRLEIQTPSKVIMGQTGMLSPRMSEILLMTSGHCQNT